jgi:hypothetical protein
VNRKLTTNLWLWWVFGLAVFGLLGFFDPLPGSKGNPGPLWSRTSELFSSNPREQASATLEVGLCYATIFVPIAILLGWAMQAMVVLVMSWLKRAKN